MPNLKGLKEEDIDCQSCVKAKFMRRPSKGPLADPANALDSIEGDIFEISPAAFNKASVVLLLVDRKTRFRWAFLLTNKRGDTIFKTIKAFFKSLKNKYNRYPKRLFYDGGKEVNNTLENWLLAKGIDFVTSSPYVHEQNGLIERSVRVLIERLRATIISADLPKFLWCFILPAVLDLINNTAVTNKELTPYQALMDDLEPGQCNVPDLRHYRIIGAPCEALIPPEKRSKSRKLAGKTEPARLLAVLSYRTFLVWVPAKRIAIKTLFIKLRERALFKDDLTAILEELLAREGEIIGISAVHTSGSGIGNAAPEKPILSPAAANFDPELTDLAGLYADLEGEFSNSSIAKKLAKLLPKNPENQHKSLNTSLNWLWPEHIAPSEPANCYYNNNPGGGFGGPGYLNNNNNAVKATMESEGTSGAGGAGGVSAQEIGDLIRSISFRAIKRQINVNARKFARKKVTRDGEPQSLAQVLKSPLSGQWLDAISAELTQLLEFGTFQFLPKSQLPKDRKPLTSRVVYRYKKNAKGKIVKFKARLVVRGFMQIEGIDFIDTFASTTIPPT